MVGRKLTRRALNRGACPQPFPFRSVGNVDDPCRHRLVPVSVGPRGGQVERPNGRDAIAGEDRQRNNLRRCAVGHAPKSIRRKLKVELFGRKGINGLVAEVRRSNRGGLGRPHGPLYQHQVITFVVVKIIISLIGQSHRQLGDGNRTRPVVTIFGRSRWFTTL